MLMCKLMYKLVYACACSWSCLCSCVCLCMFMVMSMLMYIPLNTEIFLYQNGSYVELLFTTEQSTVGDIYVWIAHHECYILNGLHNHGIIIVTRNFTLNIPT